MERTIVLIVLSVFVTGVLLAQDFQRDSLGAKPSRVKKDWIRHAVELNFINGVAPYYDSYSYETLRRNIKPGDQGFPIHNDWDFFTQYNIQPEFYQLGGSFQWADTTQKMKMEVSAIYLYRRDSINYQSAFAVFDTVFLRQGAEVSHLFGAGFAVHKETRPILKVFRFYGGLLLELYFAPSTRMNYYEFTYDYGLKEIVESSEYQFKGKPRFNAYASAMVGSEIRLHPRMGITMEARSGFGANLMVGEPTLAIAKTVYVVGGQYYLRRIRK